MKLFETKIINQKGIERKKMKSNTQNILIGVAWILLILMLLPSIIMSSLGLSNLNAFHTNRNNYLYQEYNNITVEIANNYTNSSSNEVASEIAALEQLLLQIQFGTNNSGSTSMIQEGTVRWCVDYGFTLGCSFSNLPANAPNSTYRAYTTVLYGITYYVIALDPYLNNGPIQMINPGYQIVQTTIGVAFGEKPFLGTDLAAFYNNVNFPTGEIRSFVMNTTECDVCFRLLIEATTRFRCSGLTECSIYQTTTISDTPFFPNPVNFTIRPVTQFLFFK